MSISIVDKTLDDIATIISQERRALVNAKARIATAVGNLNSIPTTHAEALSEIGGYVPEGAFEELCKDKLTKLTAEFVALRDEVSTAVTTLSSITEF